MNDFFKNPITVIYAVGVTFFISIWTILELSVRKVSRKTMDSRLRWWAKSLLNNIDLNYTIHNPHNLSLEKGKSYIVMCNHSSQYDIPLSLMAVNGSVRMLAKKELFDIPIWGKGMKKSDFVSIDRNNPRQAVKDMRYARTMMKKGIVLWIAPEGTRSKTGKLQPFKTGGFRLAIESGATIIPLGIVGSNKVMQAKSLKINKGKQVDIYIGKPVDASDYSKQTRNELLKAVESQIRFLIGQAN